MRIKSPNLPDGKKTNKFLTSLKEKLKIKFKLFLLSTIVFLIIFYLLEPQRKLFNAKDICGKWWMGQLEKEIAYKKLKLKEEGDLLEYCVHFR